MNVEDQIKTLESYINVLQSGTTGENTKTYTFEVNGVATELTKQFSQEQTAAAVLNEIQTKKIKFNKPPKYFKPAFLLEELTPMVKCSLLFKNLNTAQGQPEYETYDLFTQTTNPTLDNLHPQATHNYIKSFTYSVMAGEGAGLKGTLELIDVDNSLIEAMILRFQSMAMTIGGAANPDAANVMIEIEYGWSVPETLQKSYSQSFGTQVSVKFTDTVIFILQKPIVKYNNDGTISCTLEMIANPNLQPPFLWWKPYEELGNNPMLNYALAYFLKALVGAWDDYIVKQVWKSWNGGQYQIFDPGTNQYWSANKCSPEFLTASSPSQFMLYFGRWLYCEYMNGSGDTTDLKIILKTLYEIFGFTYSYNILTENNTMLQTASLQTLAKTYEYYGY